MTVESNRRDRSLRAFLRRQKLENSDIFWIGGMYVLHGLFGQNYRMEID